MRYSAGNENVLPVAADIARRLGAHQLIARTTSDNQAAAAILHSEGFDLTAETGKITAVLFLGSVDAVDSPLRLRPLTVADKTEAMLAHAELLPERFAFLLDNRAGEPWTSYVNRLEAERQGRDLPDGWVPSTFLVAEAAGQIVGRLSVRHRLNDHLAAVGGHLGYAVRPAYRRQGHATRMLRHGLVLLHDLNVDQVLVTCDDDNLGSRVVIENCGGTLQDILAADATHAAKRRYWIPNA